MNRGHQQRKRKGLNVSQCWHETCPRVSATTELLWAAPGDWEEEFRKDMYDLPFFFFPSQILKMNSFSGYRILLWPESVTNGSQETVGQWSIYHLFLLWHSFHPFNFVIRSSFSAKPGRIFPFSFLCFLCLISFASLCLLNQVSLQVWWCLRTITEWVTPSKMLFSRYSQPV